MHNKIYSLISFDKCTCHATITLIKIQNISIISSQEAPLCSFQLILLKHSFSIIGLVCSHVNGTM